MEGIFEENKKKFRKTAGTPRFRGLLFAYNDRCWQMWEDVRGKEYRYIVNQVDQTKKQFSNLKGAYFLPFLLE